MRKLWLLNWWSLLLQISSAIQVHIGKCKVNVSFVATLKFKNVNLNIRITTFKTFKSHHTWFLVNVKSVKKHYKTVYV